ncbi:hypothetical protein A2Z67_02440 [Candidatus Woesebacteria bacterium RBG_13_36_22]|uniref:Uncharacterized protein n=1 Tax=Candidatus Woesebacteria bacterium RBG_13_36_22 TaxID=1802478 RepID=A0A1F7X1Q5_9BACT|nr:MAG: hypothetical protein A2Z67_02440 [Candidatus Woesebacteria bacterium RBG_13_36_22]
MILIISTFCLWLLGGVGISLSLNRKKDPRWLRMLYAIIGIGLCAEAGYILSIIFFKQLE